MAEYLNPTGGASARDAGLRRRGLGACRYRKGRPEAAARPDPGAVLHGIERPCNIGHGGLAVHRLVIRSAKVTEHGVKMDIAPCHVAPSPLMTGSRGSAQPGKPSVSLRHRAHRGYKSRPAGTSVTGYGAAGVIRP